MLAPVPVAIAVDAVAVAVLLRLLTSYVTLCRGYQQSTRAGKQCRACASSKGRLGCLPARGDRYPPQPTH